MKYLKKTASYYNYNYSVFMTYEIPLELECAHKN